MRTRLHPADATLVAVVCCFAVGLFSLWAAHGFSWSSSHTLREATRLPVHAKHPRAVLHEHPIRHGRPSPHLTLVATRGASWISVRAGSATGRTLYEGLLSRSQHISVPGARFVVRVQGGGNLDALLGKRRLHLAPYELRDVLITAAGIRPLATSPPAPIVAS